MLIQLDFLHSYWADYQPEWKELIKILTVKADLADLMGRLDTLYSSLLSHTMISPG